MTPEEIIKQLEMLKAEIEWEHSLEYQLVLDEAIKVLGKQIPKKVIRKTIREHYRFYCPNNHFIFEEHCKIFDLNKHDFSKSRYCECCGQKLDWSEWE